MILSIEQFIMKTWQKRITLCKLAPLAQILPNTADNAGKNYFRVRSKRLVNRQVNRLCDRCLKNTLEISVLESLYIPNCCSIMFTHLDTASA